MSDTTALVCEFIDQFRRSLCGIYNIISQFGETII